MPDLFKLEFNNKNEINVFSDELILDNIFYVNNRNVYIVYFFITI